MKGLAAFLGNAQTNEGRALEAGGSFGGQGRDSGSMRDGVVAVGNMRPFQANRGHVSRSGEHVGEEWGDGGDDMRRTRYPEGACEKRGGWDFGCELQRGSHVDGSIEGVEAKAYAERSQDQEEAAGT